MNLYPIEVNSDTSVTLEYDNYIIDASANNVTMTLPDMTGIGFGKSIIFSRVDQSNFTVTIVATATTIDGVASVIIPALGFRQIVYDNNDWHTIQGVGYSGYSGYSGISGYSGFSGISGYSGFSGISGYSGFSGISGFSGAGVPAAGATGTILRSNGANWVASTNTYPDTTGINQILFATSANAIGSSNTMLTDGTYLYVGGNSSAAGVIFATTAIVAGGTYNTDFDPVIVSARTTDPAVNTNGHSFVDANIFKKNSNGLAYNSFTDNSQYVDGSGATNYDHHASFQSQFGFKGTGTLSKLYGIADIPVITSGTLTNRYGVYIFDATGAGLVTNQYGIYIPTLSKGGTSNYGVYVATNNSYFGGWITVGVAAGKQLNIEGDLSATGELPAGGLIGNNGNGSICIIPSTTGTAGNLATIGYYNGTQFYSALEIANVGSGFGTLKLMKSGGVVQIGSTSYPTSVSQGDLIYANASNVLTTLTKSTGTSNFLKNSGTSNNPAWAQPATSDLSDVTAWTDYSGTSTIVGWSSFTTKTIQYYIIGKIAVVYFHFVGAGNSTTPSFTLPNTIKALNIPNANQGFCTVYVEDNGVALTTTGTAVVLPNTSTVALFLVNTTANYSAGTGTREVYGTVIIGIQ